MARRSWEEHYEDAGDDVHYGGYAEVRRVRRKSDGRVFALKVGFERSEEQKERNRREHRILDRLAAAAADQKQANALLLPVDACKEGLWMVLPWAGESLRAYSRTRKHTGAWKPIDQREVLDLLDNCAQGLGLAHEHGIVHRDVSWQNVLRISDRPGVRWIVCDWGVALDREIALPPMTRVAVGTDGFVSPQQQHDAHDAKAADDVFGLGRVAYYALSGRRLDTGAPGLSGDLGRLGTLVRAMVEPDRKHRIQSMTTVRARARKLRGGA